MIMFVNISTASAQEIKKKNNNEFVIDSLALQEYSTLIFEKRSIPQIIHSYNLQLKEKDNTISLLKSDILGYKSDIENYKSILLIRDEKDELQAEIAKQRLNKMKWQRNKAYIGGGVLLVLSILLVASN